MPYELLLASGVRGGAAPGRRAGAARPSSSSATTAAATSASATEQVVLLHTGERGRLQVTRRRRAADGRRTLGLVTWVLFADGWRELAPAPSAGGARRRDPRPSSRPDLGGIVARLVAAVAA